MSSRDRDIEALMRAAEAGGPGAALAARRAAWLAEERDPARARAALHLAAKLEPLNSGPRLALSRLHAEAGDFDAAKAEAQSVLEGAVDQAARARAFFILGEIARLQGEAAAARTAFSAAAQIEEKLLQADRMNPHAARWFARARGRIAELDAESGARAKARNGAEGALSMLRAVAAQISETPALAADIADAEMRLGALDLDGGEAPSARKRLEQAIGRYEALILLEPNEPHWRAVLADAWSLAAEADFLSGAAGEARASIDKALALRVKLALNDAGERWALASAWRVRAALLAALNDESGAADSLAQARALAEQECARAQGREAPARFLLNTLLDCADHALRIRAPEAAHEAADAARRIAESHARADSKSALWRSDLAACWDRLGEAARAAGASARDAFARAVEFRRIACEGAPKTAPMQRALAATLLKFADAALAAGEIKSALAACSESVGLRLRLAEADPGAKGPARDLAVALERVGLAAVASGDAAGARAAWESELDLAERVFEDPESTEAQRFRAIVEAHLSQLGGVDSSDLRAAALARLDTLARLGALTERDAALRKRLWGG